MSCTSQQSLDTKTKFDDFNLKFVRQTKIFIIGYFGHFTIKDIMPRSILAEEKKSKILFIVISSKK